MLYKIWYKVLLNGTSAGTLLSCISFCGMVATIAVEMGIPVDNITKSLDVSLEFFCEENSRTEISSIIYVGLVF